MAISERAKDFAGLPVVDYAPAVGLVLPTMPRREFRAMDGKTFWAITLENDRIVQQSGKAGGAGKTSVRTCKSPEAARAEYARRIVEKAEGGYTEQPSAAATMRESLISAIKATPDDMASRNAYADFLAEQGEQLTAAYRIGLEGYEDESLSCLGSFLDDPAVGLVRALVIGVWPEAYDTGPAEIIEALVEARGRLTGLRAFFLGDIPLEDCELSWINQADITPLFKAFPGLEHFRSRGGDGLVLKKFKHANLRSLVIEASNLSRAVVKAVGASELPALEHLEVWLGTERYGADTGPGDLKGVLQGKGLPALTHLGLRNSEIADDVAKALNGAPVLSRLRSLDLSLGVLTDEGAEALLANPAVAKLEKLDIHHHFVSPELVKRLEALGPKIDARASRADEEEDYRYVAHAE